MKKQLRLALLAFLVLGFGVSMASAPAEAYFKHHHKHAKPSKKKHVAHKKSDPLLRDAQTSLINLGYYTGKADGMNGPKTIKAIRAFQHDHAMPITGKLTKSVYNAIIKADKARAMASLPTSIVPPINIGDEHTNDTLRAQAGLVGPTNQQYADPLLGGATVAGTKGAAQYARTQELSSRFAKLDVNENKNGSLRRYEMTLNGEPILRIEDQPSIIGISPTYNLGREDGIILSTYVQGDTTCPYKHYLLTLSENKNELHEFGNCTHGYQARKVEDTLFVTFPEVDDERVAGATWRYEEGDLERM